MSDATPAYRGYRLQALYTLFRILESRVRPNLVFHPEGAEDLAILETGGNLLETIQVKAYTADLSLSLLEPKKKDSFLYRVYKLLTHYPELSIKVVSFGNVGSELLRATQKDGEDRKKVVKKFLNLLLYRSQMLNVSLINYNSFEL